MFFVVSRSAYQQPAKRAGAGGYGSGHQFRGTLLYWQVGQRIRRDMLHAQRAEYGEQIVATLSQQLTWSHVVELLPLKDSLQRDFYAEMCRLENWSVRTLRADRWDAF
jgi:DUF1016 N-terminal domain